MFKNAKIGTRLLLAFAVSLVIMLVISSTAFVFLQKISNASNAMYEKDTIGISALGSYQYNFTTMRLMSYKTTYTVAAAEQPAALQKINEQYFAEMDKSLDVFKGTVSTPDEQNYYNDLKSLNDQYKAANQVVIEDTKAQDKDKMATDINHNVDISGKLNTELTDAINYNNNLAKTRNATNVSMATKSFAISLALTLAGIIISVILALTITRNITKPVNKLVAGANKMAKGDMDVALNINSNDEIGVLAKAFEGVVQAVNLMIGDINTLVDATKNGDLKKRADVSQHHGQYAQIINGFNENLDAISAPVEEVTAVLKRIALNDYTQSVTGKYMGDMKAMADAGNEIIQRLNTIQGIFIDIANGDLSKLPLFIKSGKRCENDFMTPAGISMMQSLANLADEANTISEKSASGDLSVRGDVTKYKGIYSKIISGINSSIDAMAMPMSEAFTVLASMGNNDFSSGIAGEYKGEFEEFGQSVNNVIDTLNQTLSNISVAAEQVHAGTQQVSAGSQALSQGATEQASSIEQLTASVTDIAGQTRKNAMNASQANDLALAARDVAVEGNDRMRQMQVSMAGINEASANISKIIKVIDDIAFQTNLLALNAAVEAARAGQNGKGFAVVAEEVRSLAQRSAAAAKETTELIEESIKRVKDGTSMADETEHALRKIVEGVEKASELVGGIAKASNDQATAVAQVNMGIEQVSHVVQTNSATAEESAAASEELSSQATMLKEMVDGFVLKSQPAAENRQKSARAPKALPEAKPAGKPKIVLNDKEFGKY